MQQKQAIQAAALQARTLSAFGGGGVPVPQMQSYPQTTTSMQYGAASSVAPPQSWAQGGEVSQPAGQYQTGAAQQLEDHMYGAAPAPRGTYPVRH